MDPPLTPSPIAFQQYYMTTNLLHPTHPPANPALFVAQSTSYMIIPLLLTVRFALYEKPFGVATSTSVQKSHKTA